MSKRMVLFTFLAGIAFFGSAARGGLISFTSDASYTWFASGAAITQGFGSCVPITVTINTEADSTFTIAATITNHSNIVWTGYILSLDPQDDATFVGETAGSSRFNTVLYPDAWTIEFWAPEVVLPGEAVTLEFGISIPDDGPYTFTLTQTPIPEPATAILLTLGAAFLVCKRRKPK